MRPGRHVTLRALARVGQHYHAGFGFVRRLQHGQEVAMKAAGNHQHGRAELIQRHEHLFLGLRLRHNAHFVFNRQYFGDSRAEYSLIVGQN